MTAQEARKEAMVAGSILQDTELKAVLSIIKTHVGFGVFSVEVDKPRFWNSIKSKLEELDYIVAEDGKKLKISW